MANYGCRIYLNTGFNGVNVPGSPALLEQCAHFDTTTIGVMQGILSSVRVRATWEQVENADYMRIYNGNKNYYFSIPSGGVTMLANDTAEIALIYDFLLSAGGVNNIEILDGITKRVHVTDDTFGKYTEEDPLTMPAQPLELQTVWLDTTHDAQGNANVIKTYVEATISLPDTAVAVKGYQYVALASDWHSPITQNVVDDSVVVPAIEQLSQYTHYKLDGVAEGTNPMTMLYNLNDTQKQGDADYNAQETVQIGMKKSRALGIEKGAIINQVQIPTMFADVTQSNPGTTAQDSEGKRGTRVTITEFTGKKGFVTSNIPYTYTGARNNRVNYGEFTKYGIISCSGESCEFRAEDINDPQNPTSPVLKYIADPHTDGRPYYRYRYVNGDASDIGFFRNCIAGLQWKQIPLYYTGVSGSALNTLKYDNSRQMQWTNYRNDRTERDINFALNSVKNAAGSVMGGMGYASATTKTDRAKFENQMDTGRGGYVSGWIDWFKQSGNAIDAYNAQKRMEFSDYVVENTITAPETHFPYNSETMRDFFGNGCMMYRYKYSAADINRIDKLLTMYGYRYTKPLEKSDFTNKQIFNYVECANVSIGGSLPKWLAEGVATMLKNGVRIWHVLPNAAYYDQDNPNA